MFPDYRVKTAFQHGKGVIDKKVPFKNNKRLKKNIIYRLFRNTADPKGASKQSFKRFYNKCWGEEIFFPHPIFA